MSVEEAEQEMKNGTGIDTFCVEMEKEKTSAAIGLAVRAAGSGLKVLFTQFLKMNLPENWRFSMIFLRLKYFILKSLMAF